MAEAAASAGLEAADWTYFGVGAGADEQDNLLAGIELGDRLRRRIRGKIGGAHRRQGGERGQACRSVLQHCVLPHPPDGFAPALIIRYAACRIWLAFGHGSGWKLA